mmetsp:Transcript_11231/g.21225  ORF Transcript_11231/g.21225 Transcript_11231/m.21225 type:complete len:251 (+) Transcript_11231:340-1092(+)
MEQPSMDIESGNVPLSPKGELSDAAIKRSEELRKWPLSDYAVAFVCIGSGIAGLILVALQDHMAYGFLLCCVALAYSLYRIREAAVAADLWDSVAQLQEENHRLQNSVNTLESLNVGLEQTMLAERAQLQELREITDLVGAKGDAMVSQLSEMYTNYKAENDRQTAQNDRQQSLLNQETQFMVYKLMKNFDEDASGTLSESELNQACDYMSSVYPTFRLDSFKDKLQHLEQPLKIKDVQSLVTDVVGRPV